MAKSFNKIPMGFRKIKEDKSGNLGFTTIAIGVIMALVVSGALLSVGLNVNSGITKSSNIQAGDPYYNASQSVVEGTTGAYEMSGTMQIVIVSGGVIMLLLGVFGGYGAMQRR